MDHSQTNRIVGTVRHVVEKLATGHLIELLGEASVSRLSLEELAAVIADYGIDIIVPDELNAIAINTVEASGSSPKAWSVDYELVDRNTGPSDLTLQLTVIENHKPLMEFELDDIHVL